MVVLVGKIKMIKILNFFKKYWLFILLGAITATVVVLRLFYVPSVKLQPTPTPKPLSLTPPQIEGQSLPRSIQVSLENFLYSKTMKIYQGVESRLLAEKAKTIAQQLGFTTEPQISQNAFQETFYNWAKNGEYLSINLKTSEINYGKDPYSLPLTKEGTLLSPTKTQETLYKLLEELDLVPSYSLQALKEQYLALLGPVMAEVTQEEAELIMVGLNPVLADTLLLGQNPHVSPISIMLDKGNNLVSFKYQSSFSSFDPKEEYQLKTIEEIEQTISKEGKIVFLGLMTEAEEVKLRNINLNQAKIAYLQPLAENLIQPIFVLSGTATLETKEVVEVTVYLPAVSFTPAP